MGEQFPPNIFASPHLYPPPENYTILVIGHTTSIDVGKVREHYSRRSTYTGNRYR